IAELGTMYRLELSGELAGLSRVRAMTLNDAHIFCTREQMLGEFINVVKLIQDVYRVMGFEQYSYRLSLRDPNDKEKFEDNETMWQESEAALRQALDTLNIEYYEGIGDAAFYGPKLDVQVANVLGKDETISTVQLDFTLPEKFDLEYIAEDGQPKRPVMIHRGILSTMERFMAFLIENYAGNFPVWLAPVQAVVIPIADDRHADYARQVAARLHAAGLRVEVDMRKERMNAKVRDAQLQKIPYMLVVGDKEMAADAVAVRLRTNENVGPVPLADFLAIASRLNAERSLDLWPAREPADDVSNGANASANNGAGDAKVAQAEKAAKGKRASKK
ncbi:MAG TPA: aminoacyl--tRNA ligase-related protein, partial [Ktedonobacterales bacterium]|nr:aminoacyl--tRNA ligase-related protein [Ktedonobacterales bacterium]